MSCILYRRCSYKALGKDKVFREACEARGMDPMETAWDLFELNLRAFEECYDTSECSDAIEAARLDDRINEEFKEFLSRSWEFNLSFFLARIECQFSKGEVNKSELYKATMGRLTAVP